MKQSAGAQPRILIIIRAGRNSIHRSWTWTVNGFADIALSVYDDTEFSSDGARFIHKTPGGKFPGIAAFLEAFPNVINEYDYFWLFEDDLVLPLETLRQVSSLLGRFQFELSSPAITYYSFFTWPIMVRNDRFIFRGTNFVEVMAPIMSRKFLLLVAHAFNDNYSGWGHEWLWHKHLGDLGSFAAIFDCAPITHSRPFGSGSLIKNRLGDGWDAKKEKDEFLAKHGLEENPAFRNFFGLTNDATMSLLAHDEFLHHALGGYQELLGLRNDSFVRCIDTLIRGARPITSYEQLRPMRGFQKIEEVLQAEENLRGSANFSKVFSDGIAPIPKLSV